MIEKRADKYNSSRLSRETTFDSPSTSGTGRAAFANRVFAGSRPSSRGSVGSGAGAEQQLESGLDGASDTSSMYEEISHAGGAAAEGGGGGVPHKEEGGGGGVPTTSNVPQNGACTPPDSTQHPPAQHKPTTPSSYNDMSDIIDEEDDEPDDDLPPDTVFEMVDLPDEMFTSTTQSTQSATPSVVADDDADSVDDIALHNTRLEAVGPRTSTGFGAIVQCRGVHLIGEKGTGVPNTAFGELRLAVDFTLNVAFEYTR